MGVAIGSQPTYPSRMPMACTVLTGYPLMSEVGCDQGNVWGACTSPRAMEVSWIQYAGFILMKHD